ncbi:hemagglutinin repeat-containing protein [Providencia rettgeri]|nr:hemagglutinin repeat-containing protein [Providencia rettgeri]ELR5048398.1 hemagglutinin repeat-containing protein [Providencia rettgeri]ELR5060830.1 hemagglutinin repeat-containing protein [Providencia rettgeri]ELR5098432.1 hemagglutinin repeat-containing protein [Providencia rettgeri]ELR5203434.1 hemagglutinin repeat-containing protein [Providencia rettgeri]
MNKHCYRLIFSRTHGELRVVSELAKSCSTESGQTRGSNGGRLWVTLRRTSLLLWLALWGGSAMASSIIADNNAPKNQRPDVINTQNGIPQVNIAAPNGSGISHNQYKQFDVDNRGAILNNSAVMTSTQTAGMIQGNPNLDPNKAPARVILNEVNSNNPSQIKGFLEVAGGKAQVIVANPSGIICNGCGTINAGRMTLTTGKPQFNQDGSLSGYQVERGVIRVEGGGLNADSRHDTQYVDLLARAVEINSGVWAKEKIAVVAGKNKVDTNNKATPIESQTAQPEFAIDMGQMGGMYSGYIHMVGTEKGVGVRNQGGHIQADKALTVSSNGKLSWGSASQQATTQAGGDITLTAKDAIDHQGKLHSGGTLNVESQTGSVSNTGTLAALTDVNINAKGDIRSQGNVLAGSDNKSNIINNANLTLNSDGKIATRGTLLSKQNVTATGQSLDLSQTQVAASNLALTAKQGDLALTQGKINANNVKLNSARDIHAQQVQVKATQWNVSANNLFNQKGTWVQTGQNESQFVLTGQLNNQGGAIEANRLKLNADSLNNQNARLVALGKSQQDWQVRNSVNNQQGEIGANGDLTLTANSIDNQSGTIKSQTKLALNAKEQIDNRAGNLVAGNAVNLQAGKSLNNHSGTINSQQVTVTTDNLNNALGKLISQTTLDIVARQQVNNANGFIGSGDKLTLTAQDVLNNQQGTLQSDTQLTVDAQRIDNQRGKILTGEQLVLNATADLDNQSGTLYSKDIALNANKIKNQQGQIVGENSVDIKAKNTLDNTKGKVIANETLNASIGQQLANQAGLLQSGNQALISALSLDNRDGKVLSGKALDITTTEQIDNAKGEISSQNVNIHAAHLDNQTGKVIATQNLDLTSQGDVNNQSGLLEAGNQLTLNTQGDINNQKGTLQAGKQTDLNAENIDNTQGQLLSGNQLIVNTQNDLNNNQGKVSAGKTLQWQGNHFNNTAGLLQSGGTLALTGNQLSNQQKGQILSQDALSFTLSGDFNNQAGIVTSQGDTAISANLVNNAQGAINALGRLNVQVAQLIDNRDGRIFSQQAQTLNVHNILNQQGWMGSLDSWQATTQSLNNQNGEIQSQKNVELTTNALENQQGTLQAGGFASLLVAKEINNTQGKISASQNLTATGQSINNLQGQLLSGGTLQLSATNVDNSQGGLLYSQKQLLLSIENALNNAHGKLQSGENLTLTSKSLDNTSGKIESQQALNITSTERIDNTSGSILSNQNQQLETKTFNNQQGTVSSLGELALNATELDNRVGTVISQQAGSYNIAQLNNTQGKIHSGDALTLTASDIQNQQGQLVSTKALKLIALTLDNRHNGILSSQGRLSLLLNALDNRENGLVHGSKETTLTVKNIENTQGRLQSNENLAFSGVNTLNNQSGQILANGDIALNTDAASSSAKLALLNQQGTLQSGSALAISTQSINNQGGTIKSQKALSLTAAQDYTHRVGDTLTSNQSVTLNIAGALTNLTDWLLPGDFTLSSLLFTNQGSLVSKNLAITTGKLNNLNRLEADKMTLDVDALNNSATLMGDEIRVKAKTLDNQGKKAVIAAAKHIDLQTEKTLTNRDQALIYSGDTLALTSDDLIENNASFIEAEGAVSITARQLNNLREGLDIQREAEVENYKKHLYNFYWRSFETQAHKNPTAMAPTTQQLTFQNDQAALDNKYGTILDIDAKNKRAQMKVKQQDGQVTTLWVNYLALTPNSDGSYAMTFYESRGVPGRIKTPPTPYHGAVWRVHNRYQYEVWDPNQHIDVATATGIDDFSWIRERSVTGSVTRDKLISEGIGARILSGGNMTLNITDLLKNDASTITSTSDLDIKGKGHIENTGYSVNERRKEFYSDHYDVSKSHWYPQSSSDKTMALTTIDGIISGNGNVSITSANITNTTVNAAQITALEAAMNAAKAERAEWERNPLAFDIDGVNKQDLNTAITEQGKSELNQADGTSPIDRPLLPAELALTEKQHIGDVATSIPDNGLFRPNLTPDSPFLVVTDPRFTDRNKFISSDYLLERVGYSPADVHKRLGDGFYEQRLVREQVLKLTGRPSLREEDAMAQYQYLMNNGIKVAEEFNLRPGVALTPAQIATLQQDIVWLVSETINTPQGPQTVWVPKVYLANTTLSLTQQGAMISGKTLNLSADSIDNAGNLLAEKGLEVDAKQFMHRDGDIKADTINIQADSLTLSTNLQDALRQATMSATDITLSGHDVQLQGAKLDATGDIKLNARDNLSITAVKSTHTGSIDVIAGAMGERGNEGMDATGSLAHINGEWQLAQSSELNAGGNLSLSAGKDITVKGSQAQAGGTLDVNAGGDINILSDKTTNKSQLEAQGNGSSVSNTREEDRLVLSTLSGDKGVSLNAGNNLVAEGAQVDSQAGKISVSAQDVTITAATQDTHALDQEQTRNGSSKGSRVDETSSHEVVGSTFSGQNGVDITARDKDITVTGSTIHSEKGEITLDAKQNVTLNTATEENKKTVEEQRSSKGFLSASSEHTLQHDETIREKGSLLSGEKVTITAGNDLTVKGSSVVAENDVSLTAGNNVDISAATETDSHYLLEEKKKSGLMSSGGIGFSVGKQSSRHEVDEKGTTQSQSVSTIGSTQGNVNITAGNKLHVGGADLIAQKDLNLTGDSVQIDPGYDERTRTETFETQQSGFGISLSGSAGSALNTAVSTAQQARKESDGRLSALQNTKAVLSGVQAQQAYELDGLKTDAANAHNLANNLKPGDEGYQKGATNTVGVSVSYGSQSSKSETHTDSRQSQGSTLNAGQNLSITATGKNKDSNPDSGNITVVGSELKAGKDLSLSATQDINLVSAQNTEQTNSKNSSKGSSVGVGVGVGEGGYGVNVSASVNQGKGHEKGNGLTHTETTLDAGNKLTLNSGQDTTLKGAQVSGEQVTVNVGRDLTLQSEQDSDHYDAKQQEVSVGGGYTIGSGTPSINISASQDKIHSNYNSVKEQTGIFAGKGGFDINVKEHTQLDGAVIASTADKDKNRLDTGTLGWKDIDNKADFTAEHTGGSISTGGPIGSQLVTNAAGGLLSNANNSGHAEGTTKSAVSDGTVIVRNEDKQKQDVNELNRDTEHANDGSINPIFDKEKEQNRLKQSQLIGEIGNQTMDIIRTEGDIAGLKAQKDPDALAVAKKQLEAAGKTPTEQAIKDQAYNNAMAQYGTGSDFQKAAQAVTGLLQGLAGDNLAGALANASSPYLATKIKELTKGDDAANAMAHAVLGAVVAELNNQSAVAGGLGAGGGELSAHVIMNTLFPGKEIWELSESEKQQVSALSQLASGLAGGLTTGDVAGAITGSQAAKNAVENNLLSNKFGVDKLDDKGKALQKKLEDAGIGGIDDLQAQYIGCKGNSDCERNVRNEYRNQEKAAGEKLVGLYQSGQLSKEEFNYLVTEYTTAMLLGIEQGEKLSDTGFDWIGDIYRLSGSDWTVAGQINNPYLNAIRSSELIADWKAQGLSDEKIQEKILKDNTLGGVIAPIDVNAILKLVDNGATAEDLAKAATGMVLAKVLQGKKNNTSEQTQSKTNNNPEISKVIPENFTSKITEHNTQLGVLNAKKTGISGAHKQDAFLESVEITGAKINLKTTDKNYPGLIEYKYQLPAIAGNGPNAGKVIGYKKAESKTTYDPKILSDAKVTNMSNQAAKQSEDYFKANPSKNLHDVKVDGYWFRVTKDTKTGQVSNAFITMPPRNSK